MADQAAQQLDQVLAKSALRLKLDPAADRIRLLQTLQAEYDTFGPYQMAKAYDVLVNNSGEEFAIQFMTAFNEEVRPNTY